MNRTILLADDSSTIRKIIELTFQDSPIRVETASSGTEALEKLERLQPDLLLADVIMPEPTGYELCDQVKRSGRPVPVVLLTGAFEAFDADRARECGADDRLVKPFESQMLRATVERLLSASAVPVGAERVLPPEDVRELDDLGTELERSRPDQAAGDDGEPDDDVLYEVPTDWQCDEFPLDLPVEVRETSGAATDPGALRLSPEDIEAVADAVVRRLSGDVVRDLAREMLPEIATTLVRQRIRELEGDEGG